VPPQINALTAVTAGIVESDLREGFSHSLSLLADGAIIPSVALQS
jgi:hypothetical protein